MAIRPTLTHFDRSRFAYVLRPPQRQLLRANKFDSTTNWASSIDLKTGRPVLNPRR
jgi:glucose dehydrogenase